MKPVGLVLLAMVTKMAEAMPLTATTPPAGIYDRAVFDQFQPLQE